MAKARAHLHEAVTERKLAHAQSGTARAALLGISDGLVTNVSLILGLAGAHASPGVVRVAGIASLMAGAFSMAVGEYVSMRGQVELITGVLDTERRDLESHPEITAATLREVLIADGMSRDTANKASSEILRKPERAMALVERGHLGINSDELGSAWGSAISSLLTFSLGALLPLLPWFFASGRPAALSSIAIAGAGALGIGGYLGYVTSGRIVWSALRQVLLLALAAGTTYAIGLLFNTTIS
jgi:VIT1/CCC1 family predicted Fe2+/Mn2+ transporter